jgi:hypothetical protein
MRDTDYFMSTAMFDAAYPFATDSEKEAEKAYIQKNYSTVVDKNVKGVWVTSDVALQIAKEYELTPYIEALIAASPDKPSDTLIGAGKMSESGTTGLVPLLEEPRRSRRSVSPKKGVTKARAPSSTGRGRKKKGSVKDDESVASSVKNSPVIPHAVVTKAEETIGKIVEEEQPVLDTIKVGVRLQICCLG